MLNSQYCGPVA